MEMEKFPYDKGKLETLFGHIFSEPIPNTNVVLNPNTTESNKDELDADKKLIWTTSATPDDLTLKLFQLTQYESLQIQSRAFAMVFRHRGQKEALVSAMKEAYLVVSPVLAVANRKLEGEVQALRPQLKWLSYPVSPNRAAGLKLCSMTLSR